MKAEEGNKGGKMNGGRGVLYMDTHSKPFSEVVKNAHTNAS